MAISVKNFLTVLTDIPYMSSAKIYFPADFQVMLNTFLLIFYVVCAILMTDALGMHAHHKLSHYFVAEYA
jgi:hypothetical protein